ncbi:MAG: cysteine desulfurase family protein [bacterium]|nr:cysteine desulfurase family protein [bacterium]
MNYPLYLDYNSTTPLDSLVLEEMLPVMQQHFGNPASSTHAYGWYAEGLVDKARARLARLLEARAHEFIFTSGATESNNLAILGCSRQMMAKYGQCKIITAATEHRAVLAPVQAAAAFGCQVKLLPIDKKGHINLDDFGTERDDSPHLISLMLANNETGVIHDIAAITRRLREIFPQAIVHCDATQAIGKIPVSLKTLDVDLLSLSAHKFYGPKGTGALYIRATLPDSLISPILLGGSQERGLRPGTLNVPAIVGMGRAAELAGERLNEDAARMHELSTSFLAKLRQGIPDLKVNGDEQNRLPGTLNISIPGMQNSDIIQALSHKIAISAVSACSSSAAPDSHVLLAMNLEQTTVRESLRISLGRPTTAVDMEQVADLLLSLRDKACKNTVN